MTTVTSVSVGSTPAFNYTFVDANNNPADPTTLKFHITSPGNGTDVTYTYGTDAELTKVSVGVYKVYYTVNETGTWNYSFLPSGNGTSPTDGTLTVTTRVIFP